MLEKKPVRKLRFYIPQIQAYVFITQVKETDDYWRTVGWSITFLAKRPTGLVKQKFISGADFIWKIDKWLYYMQCYLYNDRDLPMLKYWVFKTSEKRWSHFSYQVEKINLPLASDLIEPDKITEVNHNATDNN